MRFTCTQPPVQVPSDTFHCRARRKMLTLNRCLNDYLESNAIRQRRSACFRCMLGRKNREIYAGTLEIVEMD